MSDNTIDANKYWRSFEILAVRIVEIKTKKAFIYNDYMEKKVPLTRDHGIDGCLMFTLEGENLTVTIEAKLRSTGKLSLKDFASSIVNYFVNLSDLHFIITNVSFSSDAYDVLHKLKKPDKITGIGYMDGGEVQQFIQEHIHMFDDMNNEIKALLQKLLAIHYEKKHIYQPSASELGNYQQEKNLEHYLTKSRCQLKKTILSLIRQHSYLLVLEGETGVGKSFLLNSIIKELEDEVAIINIDMSSAWSQQIMIIEFVKSILHLDISQLLDLLSSDEKEEISKQIDDTTTNNADYMEALHQIINYKEYNDKSYNYLIRIFIDTLLCQQKNNHFLFYFHDLTKSSSDSCEFLRYLLPILLKNRTQVLIELDSNPIYLDKMTEQEWNNTVNAIERFSYNNISCKTLHLPEFSEEEAMDFLSHKIPEPLEEAVKDAILKRYGYRPLILNDIMDFINQSHIYTKAEVERLPFVEYSLFSPHVLKNHLISLDNSITYIILYALQASLLLEGYLPYLLIGEMEHKFNIFSLGHLLLKSCAFVEIDNGIKIKNHSYLIAIQSEVKKHSFPDLYNFLLANRETWGMSGIHRQYTECLFRLKILDNTALECIENILIILNSQRLYSLESDLLFACYEYYTQIVKRSSDFITELDYLIRYLESMGYKSEYSVYPTSDYIDKSYEMVQRLMDDRDSLYFSKLTELRLRINFIYYNQQQELFRYDIAEKYIDDCFQWESYCQDQELASKVYLYKGLCMKERGIKPSFLDTIKKGIHKYPHAIYIKICYLSNYATSCWKYDIPKALRALKTGVALAEKASIMDLFIWLGNNLLICKLLKKDFSQPVLNEIQALRMNADKFGIITDISRSYNSEGVWQAANRKYSEALLCFQNAVNIFVDEVTYQPKLLFLTNKIVIESFLGMNIASSLKEIFNWLEHNHVLIYNKLQQTNQLFIENNYAAILALYKSALISNETYYLKRIEEWFPFKALELLKRGQSIDSSVIDPVFLVSGQIMILF